RESIFKKKKNYLILEVILKLKEREREKIKKKMEKFIEYKKMSQPLDKFSAGCVFKNLPGISTGKLIETLGFKGKKIGKIMVSEKHANFFLNLGQGKSSDFLRLKKMVKQEVKKRFKINLEDEIIFLR
ncbi:MAG: UDP-N-acetylmuramate dehydrogenase, partial [Minisyncoccales bacterium]